MSLHSPSERGRNAEHHIKAWFEAKGWEVAEPFEGRPAKADLLVRHRHELYAVEIVSLSEGRPDRVIPLLAQAVLQAQTHAKQLSGAKPVAVAYVEHASPSLLNHVAAFVEEHVHNAGVGIVSANGASLWRQAARGPVAILEAAPSGRHRQRSNKAPSVGVVNLFSDLNQWMLKILLAPDIPEGLLNAPRSRYRTGTELAAAAQVSTMSVSRLLKQLHSERFLDPSASHIALVRREEFFIRWRASALRTCPEVPMRLPLKANPRQQISRWVDKQGGQACMGLFAAADSLGMGHVSGVPPYVCMSRLPRPGVAWPGMESMVAFPEGVPDFIIRQAASPRSTFLGAVRRDGTLCTDVIQTWLDVSNHPLRGEEQADHIYRKVLRKVIDA